MNVSIKKIMEDMPKDLTDIEKLRYAYLECAKVLSYDRDYLYDNINDDNGDEKYNQKINIFNIDKENHENKIKCTCKQMADIYVQIVNNIFGREIAKVIGHREGAQKHVAILVELDGNNYYMDLYNDLYRIQKGLTTKHFAPSRTKLRRLRKRFYSIDKDLEGVKCKTIPEKKLKKIDEKLGYVKNGLYMDDAISRLRQEMQDKESWKKYIKDFKNISRKDKKDAIFRWKIDFIFRYLKNNIQDENKLEEIEIERYFKKIYYSILSIEEIKNNKLNTIHIHYNEEPSILFRIDNLKGNMYYIYNNDENGFNETNYKKLIEMQENGEITYDYILQKAPDDDAIR